MRLSQANLIAAGIVLIALLIIISQTFYVVDETKQALVLRLGEPVRVVNSPTNPGPGLQAKYPFVEEALIFEKRSISLEPPAEEVLASNQERLVVDSFLRYQIVDPLQFYRAVRDERSANDRLQRLVSSSLRQALGAATTEEIIATDRSEIMQRVLNDVDRRVEESRFGVEIVDLRIKRADLPDENANAVFDRMSSQRRQEAAEIRARGAQQAQEIVADATREAETTRGEGNAERARLFAESFGRDPSFAQFYRSMRAYEAAMAQGNTTMVLSPDSDFFTYFENGPGG